MNAQRILVFSGLIAVLLLAVAFTSGFARASRDSSVSAMAWTVVSAGSGHAASTSYSLDATLGQPLVGTSSSTDITLSAGFWQENSGYRVYLPVVLK